MGVTLKRSRLVYLLNLDFILLIATCSPVAMLSHLTTSLKVPGLLQVRESAVFGRLLQETASSEYLHPPCLKDGTPPLECGPRAHDAKTSNLIVSSLHRHGETSARRLAGLLTILFVICDRGLFIPLVCDTHSKYIFQINGSKGEASQSGKRGYMIVNYVAAAWAVLCVSFFLTSFVV